MADVEVVGQVAADDGEELAPATVPFHGVDYEIADKIGLMPQMRFAKLAQTGADIIAQDSLVAMYDLIEQCFAPAAWERFQEAATAHRADAEELMTVVGEVFLVLAGRPTQRRSVSSDGPSITGPSSTSSPADRAIAHLAGRPDLQLIVVKAQEALAS